MLNTARISEVNAYYMALITIRLHLAETFVVGYFGKMPNKMIDY